MDMRKITDDYFVAPQIDCADLAEIAAAGFKTVICNRPDNEVPLSHQAAAIKDAALGAGLDFYELPLNHHTMTPAVLAQQLELAAIKTPTLAYCASGTRCTVAWALGSAMTGGDVDQILEAAGRGGYDLQGLRATLMAAAQAGPPAKSD